MTTRNWSIRSKIVALVAVPLVALLALWIFATSLTVGPAFHLLSAQTVLDTVEKVRTQFNERTEAARKELPGDLSELREKFTPEELRKRVDSYGKNAKKVYDDLAERGEKTLQRLQDQPQVKKVWDQVGTAQDKVEDTVGWGACAETIPTPAKRSTSNPGAASAPLEPFIALGDRLPVAALRVVCGVATHRQQDLSTQPSQFRLPCTAGNVTDMLQRSIDSR